ncbi:MAG: RagB/SusD family nutrient uptake outer membrane protein [Bacteroidales bacterium]|jgi:hypothetical protein|nr:RagB/SusD family nutrient uptake outer membrane protein [Bacteroidales bacterium]MCI1786247.1 RagB/SusD family nutrient uptake outer membrane protein [Bacteroidales bacterium]
MKKNKLISGLILISAAVLSCGCSGFLDESTNGKVFDNVLDTETGLESALVGAYRGWANCWTYGFNNGWATEMTLGGDDLTCPPGTGNTQEFDRYLVHDTNSSSPTVYWGCYKAIQGANNVIEHADGCSGDADNIKAITGEAHFIRAFSYFWLVRCYGKVPLIKTAVFSTDDVSVDPASISDVYDLIESDLDDAIKMLSNSRRSGQEGRPNIGSAKALLAEVYLAEAGFPLKKSGYYAKAAAMAGDVIKNRITYGFDFEDSYDVLYENDETKTGYNKEDIFMIPCNKSAGNDINAMYGFWAYPGELGGWDVVFSELTFFNKFPAGPRKDATFAYTVTTQDGKVIKWQDLKYARPYYKKLMKNPDVSNYYNYASQIPMRMLRFTQTALTYAEAKARSDGPDALAYEMLNRIRTRAGLSTYSGLGASDFADKCVQERAWELCGERVRWFDIVRLELLDQVIAEKDPSDNQPLHAVSESDYFFPIPQHDALLNAKLNSE